MGAARLYNTHTKDRETPGNSIRSKVVVSHRSRRNLLAIVPASKHHTAVSRIPSRPGFYSERSHFEEVTSKNRRQSSQLKHDLSLIPQTVGTYTAHTVGTPLALTLLRPPSRAPLLGAETRNPVQGLEDLQSAL